MNYTVYYMCNGIKTDNAAKIFLFYSSETEHHGIIMAAKQVNRDVKTEGLRSRL